MRKTPAQRAFLKEAQAIAGGDYSAQGAWQRAGMTPIAVPKAERPACGAKCRTGQPCRAKVVPGRKRCRMHNGGKPPNTPALRQRQSAGMKAYWARKKGLQP